uniref:Kappa-actitoxin-Tel potassium channel toxin type 5 n=1 Tax=Telmatactis sp. JMS-2017 TaxID=2056422 RepID=A0A3P8MJU9_9CNID|nr:Kappa-actitoxin-Tel potassium channel toxin type 5 [Telmatactis sp. JMS-2017]
MKLYMTLLLVLLVLTVEAKFKFNLDELFAIDQDKGVAFQKRCLGYTYGPCTANSECCDETDSQGRKLRCSDRGGRLSTKKCLYRD